MPAQISFVFFAQLLYYQSMSVLLVLQLAVTSALCGLIWVIQAVHYPSFYQIAKEQFSTFHLFHQNRMTWIAAPLMISELGLAVAIAYQDLSKWTLLNLLTAAALWAFTFVLSVPLHNKLSAQRDTAVIHRLIQTNWPRTFLWTLRTLVLTWVLVTGL